MAAPILQSDRKFTAVIKKKIIHSGKVVILGRLKEKELFSDIRIKIYA